MHEDQFIWQKMCYKYRDNGAHRSATNTMKKESLKENFKHSLIFKHLCTAGQSLCVTVGLLESYRNSWTQPPQSDVWKVRVGGGGLQSYLTVRQPVLRVYRCLKNCLLGFIGNIWYFQEHSLFHNAVITARTCVLYFSLQWFSKCSCAHNKITTSSFVCICAMKACGELCVVIPALFT